MAGFQLDDLLKDDKKDSNLIPDLSKATCDSQEEFRRLMECCPEFKIKPEKLKRDDIKVRDKNFTWKTTKKELRALRKEWNYGNPIPPDMRMLNIQELQQVAIDWRMLTSLRPKIRQDEEMFSRLVEMGKLQLKTRQFEQRNFVNPIRRAKNRAGIIESSVQICGDCGEEFCNGESCGDILYDSYIRVTVKPSEAKVRLSADATAIIAGIDSGKAKPGHMSDKKKQKCTTGDKSVRSTKVVTRKVKTGNATARKEDNEDNVEETNNQRKFRRKCTKNQTKKRSARPASSKI